MKQKQEPVVIQNHVVINNEVPKVDHNLQKGEAPEIEVKGPHGIGVIFRGKRLVRFIMAVVVAVALIGTSIYGISSYGASRPKIIKPKITFILMDGDSFPVAISKEKNNAPWTYAEGFDDVYYKFKVKSADVYKIVFKRLSEPQKGKTTDVTNNYRTGRYQAIVLDLTYLVAFETNKGTYYTRLIVRDILKDPDMNRPYG